MRELTLHKGEWQGKRVLDGVEVPIISAHFYDTQDGGDPMPLPNNSNCMFMGSIFLGDGFLLDQQEAKRFLALGGNGGAIFPLLNGQEINSHPAQEPSRFIICLEACKTLEDAAKYPELLERLRERVLPGRLAQKNEGAKRWWWRYYRYNETCYERLKSNGKCFVAARTTKYLSFSQTSGSKIFTDAVYVFTTNRWDLYAVVQSTLHEVWARKYSGALKEHLRYSPTDCFETFPFPDGLWQTPRPVLAELGEYYHEHRRALMRQLWLGLTDVYNLFHTRELTPIFVAKVSKKPEEAEAGMRGILELRRLHSELDEAIRDSYGWSNLNLGHAFVEIETLPENDRVRYTISPEARKEVLTRLLQLNHQRAAEEEAAAAVKPKAKRSRKAKQALGQGVLIG